MTTFYLIRHGEKKKEIGDPGLSDIGKKQAQQTAQHLSQFPITVLYASPFARTRETAQHIADTLGLEVTIDSSLKERMNWEIPNQSFEEFLKEWEKATKDPLYKPQGGDSVVDTAKRLENIMRELSQKYTDQHVVLVTHGGTIRDFLAMQAANEAQEVLQRTLEGIRECSVTKVIIDGETLRIEFFDDISHLQ